MGYSIKYYIDPSDKDNKDTELHYKNKAINTFNKQFNVNFTIEDCELTYVNFDVREVFNKNVDGFSGRSAFYKGEHVGYLGYDVHGIGSKVAMIINSKWKFNYI